MELNDLKKIAEDFKPSVRMPALFIGHGSPMNALEDNPFTRTLQKLAATIQPEPKAILVISAHWLTHGTFVNNSAKPKTIHDFGGFPDELYRIQYPSPGSPEFAKETKNLSPLIDETSEWGLDHGTWTILKHIYPDANIPVFQLSIDYDKPMQYHFDLATQISSLRNKGVMILGSGNIVHNLRLSMTHFAQNNPEAYDWAIEFDEFVKSQLDKGDYYPLINFDKNKAAALAVPTVDHYVPMLYTLGVSNRETLTQLYEEVSYGGISMRSFRIG